ncbi:hypothetical protein, partial [Flavobacterium frigidimaris]
ITTSTTVIPKTRSKHQNTQPKTASPYDPQHPYKEPQSGPKDITGKDIEKDLIENDPSKGFETDRNTQNSNEVINHFFETIEPDQDNPVKRKFEIGQLGNEELKEDELTRDASRYGAPGYHKPSQQKF